MYDFTKEHKKFFAQPKTLKELSDLFGGDTMKANGFMSVNLIAGKLERVEDRGEARLANAGYNEMMEIARYAQHG